MRKTRPVMIVASAIALVLAMGIAWAQSNPQDADGKRTFTGTVTDTVCGLKHMMKDMTDAECAKMCVQHGADYALAVGSKIYVLHGKKDKIEKFAGKKVKVIGTALADTINVDSITAAGPHQ